MILGVLYYSLQKERVRLSVTEKRYEDLLKRFVDTMIGFVDTTTKYMEQTITVIDSLPDRQKQMIEDISVKHLESTKLVVEELKNIADKQDKSLMMKDEFREYLKQQTELARKEEREACKEKIAELNHKREE